MTKGKTMHGYIVGVEIDADAITPEQIAATLADSASLIPGVTSHEVEYLGEIEQTEEDSTDLSAFDSLTKN